MNESVKAIIFDIGGVLIRTEDYSGRSNWERRLGLNPGGAEAIVLNSDMGHRAQRGEITYAALWNWVGQFLELGEELPTFRQDFWRGDFVDQALVALIRKLRPSYKLAVISNATDALLETLAEYDLLDEFDLVVGSAFERVMKPNPLIYTRTLERLGCLAEETVFIDDAPANVAGARALGMNAILFEPTVDLAAELATFGVNVA